MTEVLGLVLAAMTVSALAAHLVIMAQPVAARVRENTPGAARRRA